MLRGDLFQAQQRGLGDGRHGGADATPSGVLLVTGHLNAGAPVAQPGANGDHWKRGRNPYLANSPATSAFEAVR